MSERTQQLALEFADKDYRHGYADDFLNTFIAAQIRAMRDQRGWTQAQLAERAMMKQSRISAMEDVNYSSWSIRTLARLAEAFDVALAVCFKSFGQRIVDIEHFSPSAVLVPSYTDDLFLSLGAGAPPRLSDTSPLVPLLGNLAQIAAHFKAGVGPDRVPNPQQSVIALMAMVERTYGKTSKEYREFGEWLGRFAEALSATAQKRGEQAAAQLQEINDEIRRVTEEDQARQRQIEEARAQTIAELEQQRAALEQQRAAIEAERQQRLAAIDEAERRDIAKITTLRDALLGVIVRERERIRQMAEATAKSDVSVEQVLREIDEGLQGAEHRVEELVHTEDRSG